MIHEKELRLALVCYGGVSLAVYMHGITKELWKLLRASEARMAGRKFCVDLDDTDVAGEEGRVFAPCLIDSEAVWHEMLESIAPDTQLSVICDVLSGASAGGLNAVLLSNAITLGQSLEPLTDMWLDKADVDTLLAPEARPTGKVASRLAQFYKEPVAWLAARHSDSLASVDVPEVRAEVAMKLARFVRSRWFEPPFSGEGLTAMLDDAMEAMEIREAGPALVPPTSPVSLFVTATDYWGVHNHLALNSPPIVTEREHRRLFAFESPALTLVDGQPRSWITGKTRKDVPTQRRPVAERPALLLAARSTASFPGAFPPATIGEVDRRLAETGRTWPNRARFVESQLAGDRAPEDIDLIDGSVLNNTPFEPALEVVRSRPAHRDVDRRFIYIDPKPAAANEGGLGAREPGFFTAILRALADIPRAQPIRDNLEAIEGLAHRTRRVRQVTDAMAPDVDAAIQRAVGIGFFWLRASPRRLANIRARLQIQAAKEAGFAFGAYAQLKLHSVLDEAASLIGQAISADKADIAAIRHSLYEAAVARGAFRHEDALGRRAEESAYARFLTQLDLGFRVRRMRFFIRRLSEELLKSTSQAERESAEQLKAALHATVAPYEVRKAKFMAGGEEVRTVVKQALSASNAEDRAQSGGLLIDCLAAALDLPAWDADTDRVLVAAASDKGFDDSMRKALMRAWLGYPYYDIAVLPLLQYALADSFEELKVDRISPEDASALREGGARACLKGWQLNSFAAFFSRAYRENDYLWGRLHAAERLVDIVASSVPTAAVPTAYWKGRLFEAILDAEQKRLANIPDVFADLNESLERWKIAHPASN